MTTTASLNGVALATISEVELLRPIRPFPATRHKAVEIPGRAGSIIFPEELGDRVISLELHVLGADYDARRAAIRELAGWAFVGTVSRLIIDDEPDRYEDAILESAGDPDEWLKSASIILPFRCGPYALALSTSTEALVASTNPDSDTFTAPDVVEALPEIILTANGGTILSFTLTVNGFALSWTGTVASGASLTISSISETVLQGVSTDTELTGAFNASSVRMGDASGFFPVLVPGSNSWSIEWTGTATSVDVDVEWRERFI